MKNVRNLVLLAGAILICAPQMAYSDMVNGDYTNELGSLAPVFDISGDYTNAFDLFVFDYTLSQAPTGNLTGAGKFTCLGTYDRIDYNIENGVVKASGKVTGSETARKVSVVLTGSATGTAIYEGIPLKITKFKETSTFSGEIDEANGQVVGTSSTTVNVTFVDTSNGKSKSAGRTITVKDLAIRLPASASGGWTLALQLTPDGTKKYNAGSATVSTPAGDSANFTATGTYSSKTGLSDIQLTGVGSSKGCSLSLEVSVSGANLTIVNLSGKVFGQTLKYKAP